MALAAFALAWAVGLTVAPRMGEPVAAIYPPWLAPGAALAGAVSADAQEIRGFGRWASIIIAQSNDPAFPDRLRQSGALLVLRASALTGCRDNLRAS